MRVNSSGPPNDSLSKAVIGVRLSTAGRNLGLDSLLEAVRVDPDQMTIVSTEWSLPRADGLRVVPIRPTPHYPWHLVHPAVAAHPAVPALRDHLRALGHLPDAHVADVWLPAGAR